ncbi:MAG: trypsin-like serine protease [Bryobacterales bacterium]|jgi:V8-like Glu-specific endopeptidase|nr:trypsin-like serine protease [Bryobacterales bacterium]
MTRLHLRVPLGIALFLAFALPAAASYLSGSTSVNGGTIDWHARRHITTTLALNDPLYLQVHAVPRPFYSGVPALIVNFSDGGSGICTGSLLADGVSILTAAHCLADRNGALDATSVQAFFFPNDGGSALLASSEVMFIHPSYTGSVFDDHDIAVIRLDSLMGSNFDRHQLYKGDAVGETFEVVGYGRRGQGDTGATEDAGSRRRGLNEFDALGEELLPLLGIPGADNVLMFDFDNGLDANDAFGFWLGLEGSGLGIFESATAPGDSGGPSFVDDRVAAVTSFGLTFTFTRNDGTVLTSDALPGLNSSFGEFAGNTSVAYNASWIESVMVPEPSTWMLMGFGALLLFVRRKALARN